MFFQARREIAMNLDEGMKCLGCKQAFQIGRYGSGYGTSPANRMLVGTCISSSSSPFNGQQRLPPRRGLPNSAEK